MAPNKTRFGQVPVGLREKRHLLNERARESKRFILIDASKIESISRAKSNIGNT